MEYSNNLLLISLIMMSILIRPRFCLENPNSAKISEISNNTKSPSGDIISPVGYKPPELDQHRISNIEMPVSTGMSNTTEISDTTKISDNTEDPSRVLIFPKGFRPLKLYQHRVIEAPRRHGRPCEENQQRDSHGNCRQMV